LGVKRLKNLLYLPDMTLISTDNNKTKKCKKCFTMYLEKRASKTPERYSILQEIYESEEHFDIENLLK
jgi:Fur family ferric uptake transcriptional regulator